MDDSHHAVLESKGLNPIHAKLIIRDARALHETAPAVAVSPPPVKSIKPFPPWTERMIGTHICCYLELLRWLTILLCFVEAHSDILGPLLRLFVKDPGMNTPTTQLFMTKSLSGFNGSWLLLSSRPYPLRWLNLSYPRYRTNSPQMGLTSSEPFVVRTTVPQLSRLKSNRSQTSASLLLH
jgi:hypothetical protein